MFQDVLENKTILITGGTGSFGRKFIEVVLKNHNPHAVRVFSRDELKQSEIQQRFRNEKMRYLLGDIRDRERVFRALNGVDIVVHAAALKQVPACESNPLEAIKTNIFGTANIIDGAIDNEVEKVIFTSTDKAVNPVNLYGATKLCAERLIIQANGYVGKRRTMFSATRYGNVVGSRGSVIPIFLEQKGAGILNITDLRMTRFWLTLEQAVDFVIKCLGRMVGGEVFVPKIPSMRIIDLAKAIAPEAEIKIMGIRPGEKIHEDLLSDTEPSHTIEFDDYFLIKPEHVFWRSRDYPTGRPLPDGFRYSSETNNRWLTKEELKEIVKGLV